MKRSLKLLAFVIGVLPSLAYAHWGHVGELGGHGHAIAIGVAAAAAAAAALAALLRPDSEEPEDEVSDVEGAEEVKIRAKSVVNRSPIFGFAAPNFGASIFHPNWCRSQSMNFRCCLLPPPMPAA